jgi:hypothetical protein
MAPVVRVCKSERELTMMRWGMRLGKNSWLQV